MQGSCKETQQTRTFFIEYFIINPALGGDVPILGLHPFYKKKGMKPSYVMINAGVYPDDNGENSRQLHAFYPISSLKTAQNPFFLQAEDCTLSETHLSGFVDVSDVKARQRCLMSDAGTMEWELEIHKTLACHTGYIANRFFTALNALESFWHGEGIRTLFRGSVTLDGVIYEVTPENCFGYADKHWGKSFHTPWLLLSSCHLISQRTGKNLKHSAVAINGCYSRFLCFPLRRRLFLQLTYTGEDFEYSFAKPGSFSKCKWRIKETNRRFIWHIMAQNKFSVAKLSINCRKEHMLHLNYEAPNGQRSPNPLQSCGNGIGTIELYRKTDSGLTLIDTLTIKDTLCTCRQEI